MIHIPTVEEYLEGFRLIDARITGLQRALLCAHYCAPNRTATELAHAVGASSFRTTKRAVRPARREADRCAALAPQGPGCPSVDPSQIDPSEIHPGAPVAADHAARGGGGGRTAFSAAGWIALTVGPCYTSACGDEAEEYPRGRPSASRGQCEPGGAGGGEGRCGAAFF